MRKCKWLNWLKRKRDKKRQVTVLKTAGDLAVTRMPNNPECLNSL